MTIDEAIKYIKEDLEIRRALTSDYSLDWNLVIWLEELKATRNLDKTNFSAGYNKAVDDFYNKIIEAYEEMKNISQVEKSTVHTITLGIMEQLKNKDLAR